MRPLAGICLLVAASAAAAAWPEHDIRLINPYPVAGPADLAGSVQVNRVLRLMQNHAAPPLTDVLAEQIRQTLAFSFGRMVVLERRPRRATLEAHRHVAQAEPDGHTLLLSGTASVVIHPRLIRSEDPPPHDGLTPVALVARMPIVLIAGADSGLRDVGQLIAAAGRDPARLHYASSGDLSLAHLAGSLFGRLGGVRLVHVAYNGGNAAVNGVLSGQVETAFVVLPAALPYLRSGRVHALGIAARERYPGLSELPTLDESGVSGFEAAVWYGLFAPVRTPREIVRKLDSAIAAGLHSDPSRQQWLTQGVQAVHLDAAEFERLLQREREKWLRVLDAIAASG